VLIGSRLLGFLVKKKIQFVLPVQTPIERYSTTRLLAAALMASPKAAQMAPIMVTTRQPYRLVSILKETVFANVNDGHKN
jgi:hypothetical protein